MTWRPLPIVLLFVATCPVAAWLSLARVAGNLLTLLHEELKYKFKIV